MEPAQEWGRALAAWAIPPEIMEQAPESPWVHPPALFRVEADAPSVDTPSRRAAIEALDPPGSVLDVGCGGGGSSVPLIGRATEITGVDEQAAMLANFAAACEARHVAHHEVLGLWPAIAPDVAVHDVVVCHHVAYNVGDIDPFVRALAEHARRRVVVELTDTHPTAALAPMWRHFWGRDLPNEPTASLFVEVVRALGFTPTVERADRAPRRVDRQSPDYVAFVRRRLCLTADRDPEVARMLEELNVTGPPNSVVTVAFSPAGVNSRG